MPCVPPLPSFSVLQPLQHRRVCWGTQGAVQMAALGGRAGAGCASTGMTSRAWEPWRRRWRGWRQDKCPARLLWPSIHRRWPACSSSGLAGAFMEKCLTMRAGQTPVQVSAAPCGSGRGGRGGRGGWLLQTGSLCCGSRGCLFAQSLLILLSSIAAPQCPHLHPQKYWRKLLQLIEVGACLPSGRTERVPRSMLCKAVPQPQPFAQTHLPTCHVCRRASWTQPL